MKVVFVSGGLEQGRDGVGDYTRLLAAEGNRLGHDCRMLALHDPFVEDSLDEGGKCGRFPAGLGLSVGLEWLIKRLSEWNPEWVSLQFVPYAFHRRGFVWPALKKLNQGLKGRRLQIMFHEVWIGQHRGASLRQRLTGFLQRAMIRRLVWASCPAAVHTSIRLYRDLLCRSGIGSSILPMFGAIPLMDQNADSWLLSRFNSEVQGGTLDRRKKWWLGGIFGSIYEDFDHSALIPALSRAALELEREPACLWIGRPGRGAALWKEMIQRYGREVRFVEIGELSAEEVSQVLNSLDVGLAATPFDVIGKSSAAAAMLEHGLPVMVGNRENRYARWVASHEPAPANGIYAVPEYFDRQLHRFPPERTRTNGLRKTAAAFYEALASCPT